MMNYTQADHVYVPYVPKCSISTVHLNDLFYESNKGLLDRYKPKYKTDCEFLIEILCTAIDINEE